LSGVVGCLLKFGGFANEHGPLHSHKPDERRRGSEEEMKMMQTLWEDPSFRENFYKEYGDKLEALGYSKDGKFPFGDGK
jgi:hypothetical protein